MWKVVDDFPKYSVSDEGLVRGPRGVLKGTLDRDGYVIVHLSNRGKRRWVRVHVLVLELFVRNRRDGEQCRHLDGNPQNNTMSNLCWGIPQENADDKKHHGTNHCGICSSGYSSGLTDDSVVDIRRRVREGSSTIKDLAIELGLTEGYLRSVVNGSRWKHVPGAIKRRTNGKSVLV